MLDFRIAMIQTDVKQVMLGPHTIVNVYECICSMDIPVPTEIYGYEKEGRWTDKGPISQQCKGFLPDQ